MEEKTQNDWDINPDSYYKDREGNFILTKGGTPKKKTRRPAHSMDKAKETVRKKIKEKKKTLLKLQADILKEKKKGEVLDILDQRKNSKPTITTEADLNLLPDLVKAQILDGKAEVAFSPHPGPQTEFLQAGEKDVLYGGAAGGEPKTWFSASFRSNASK